LRQKSALPGGAYLPYGIYTGFNWNQESPYALVAENGKPVIYEYIRKKEIAKGNY